MQLVRFFHLANDDVSTLLVVVGRVEMMSTGILCCFRLICRIYIYIKRTHLSIATIFRGIFARLVQAPPAYKSTCADRSAGNHNDGWIWRLAAGFLDAAAQMDSLGITTEISTLRHKDLRLSALMMTEIKARCSF